MVKSWSDRTLARTCSHRPEGKKSGILISLASARRPRPAPQTTILPFKERLPPRMSSSKTSIWPRALQAPSKSRWRTTSATSLMARPGSKIRASSHGPQLSLRLWRRCSPSHRTRETCPSNRRSKETHSSPVGRGIWILGPLLTAPIITICSAPRRRRRLFRVAQTTTSDHLQKETTSFAEMLQSCHSETQRIFNLQLR